MFKKTLKIQYILIFCSLLIFISNIFFKFQANKEFRFIDLEISHLLLNHDFPEDFTQKLLPFTYFDQRLEDELNSIMELHNKNESLVDATIAFQNDLHRVQRTLLFGYDCTLYIAILLAVIGFTVTLTKIFIAKNESIRRQTMNEAQIKFSMDLHDGVAQDLAALKIYLDKDDAEKTKFYADQAFKEIRYMIDSMRMDFRGDFENILKETIESFGTNYKIETKFLCASIALNNLQPEIQIELLRVLQEALSNIARHSNATKVTVKITDIASDINFIICDNGVGFNEKQLIDNTENKHHYGLKNIMDRVDALGGTVNFITSGGTTIAIMLKSIIH